MVAGAGAMGAGAASAAALAGAAGTSIGVIGGLSSGSAAGGGAWSHLGSGALSAAGGLYGNYQSARQARINREFQLNASNTSHQREVEDLRAAGLNPILSAGGAGASTPGGATANQWDVGTPAVTSALTARANKAQVRQLEEAARTTREQGNTQIKQQAGIDAQIRLAEANEATAKTLSAKQVAETHMSSVERRLKEILLEAETLRKPGYFDAARFFSSADMARKRRADALSETIRGYTGALPSIKSLFIGSKPGLRGPR